MRYDGVSYHSHHTPAEEAMTDLTTTQTGRDQFVTDMMQRMATLARTLSDWVTSEPRTLGEIEQQLVRTIKDLGAVLLAGLCQLTVPAYPSPTVSCACGAQANYQRRREASVKTVLDTITFVRPYYLCPTCKKGHAPVDQQLEVCAGSISAGLDELLALLGATEDSFAQAASVLQKLTLVAVCPNSVREATERLGQVLIAREAEILEEAQTTTTLPGVRMPPAPRMYISMDGLIVHIHDEGWKEIKLGAIYTTTSRVSRKRPEKLEVRAVAQSFVTDLADAARFGPRLWAEAAQRGVLAADEVVVLGDGAHWIWNLAQEYFPGAVQILDWYHATEYVWTAAHAISSQGSDLAKRWAAEQLERLWEGKVAEVITTLQEHLSAGPAVEETLTYYTNQQQRMRYAEYRARGLQLGSGTIESGCKHVLAARLKQAGMIWDREGALAVATVRTWLKSGRWEEAMQLRVARRRGYQRRLAACGQPAPVPEMALKQERTTSSAAMAAPAVAAGAAVPYRRTAVRVPEMQPQPSLTTLESGSTAAPESGTVRRPAASHPWRKPWSVRQQCCQAEARGEAPVAPAA
jgi:hypothetical protein